jgi:hypothetical protein
MSETHHPADRILSVGGHDIGYPHGHLGYLTEAEENSLRSFKVYLEEKGLYKSGPEPSHDEGTLLYVFLWHTIALSCAAQC